MQFLECYVTIMVFDIMDLFNHIVVDDGTICKRRDNFIICTLILL